MRILIAILFIIAASDTHAQSCMGYFSAKGAKVEVKSEQKEINLDTVLTLEGTKLRLSLGKLVERVAKFVQAQKRAPTVEELANATKVDANVLKGYFAKASSPKIMQIVAMAKAEHPEIFRTFEMEYAEAAIKYLKKNFEIPSDSYMAEQLKVSTTELRVIYGSSKGALDRIHEYQYKALEQFKDKILAAYTRVAKETGRSPTLEEVAFDLEVATDTLAKLMGKNKVFDKFDDLYELARRRNPNAFKKVQNTNIFTEERLSKALQSARDSDVIVITSAVADAPVNEGFYNALRAYHKDRKASIFIRPVNLETSGLQKELLESDFAHVIINTINLRRDLSLHNLKLLAKMVDPLTGTNKLGSGETRIYGHIQRRLKTRAFVDSNLESLFNITTGALTDPDYMGGKYVQERTAEFAMERHFYGAVVLEKTSSRRGVHIPGLGRFHIRFIEYVKEVPDETGKKVVLQDPYFMDLNKAYHASGKVRDIQIEALVFGDLHFGATDQHASLESKRSLIQKFKPKRIYTHDDYDGKEINHHERDRIIAQGMLALMRANSLEEGLHYLRENLEAILEVAPPETEILRVRSNHPHWVERYLQGGTFMKESQNTAIGIELAKAMTEGMDPIDYFLKKHMRPELYRRVKTLRPGEPINEGTRPVVVHMHGDKGVNGARGSINAFIEATEASISGHVHNDEVYNRITIIGAMAKYPQPYAKEGFSKALISNAIIGPNGEIQTLRYDPVSGEYYRDTTKPLDAPEDFFAPGYPFAIPTYDPTGRHEIPAGAIDQYSR